MKEIFLDELKQLEFELLCQVDSICREQQLRYSLTGGTLIGAVRHHGFIPWDDDIDIQMPRPDYNKFIEYCKGHSLPFTLLCGETNSNYSGLFAKACVNGTRLEEAGCDNLGYDVGVNIDIFPVDGLSNTYNGAIKEYNNTSILRELLVASRWHRFFRSRTHAWYYEPIRFLLFIISRFADSANLARKIERKYSRNDFDNLKYSTIIGGTYRKTEIMETRIYSEYTELDFEGKKFMCLKYYDEYLSKIFGDYMCLPPVEKRKSHHVFKAYYQ